MTLAFRHFSLLAAIRALLPTPQSRRERERQEQIATLREFGFVND